MKINGNDKTLESYRIFPFVAWGVVFLFVFIVYDITMKLRSTTEEIKQHTQQLQASVDTPISEIKDFKN